MKKMKNNLVNYAELLENQSDFVLKISRDFSIIYANQSFLKWTGFDLKSNIYDYVYYDDKEILKEFFSLFLDSNKSDLLEIRLLLGDKILWCCLSFSQLPSSSMGDSFVVSIRVIEDKWNNEIRLYRDIDRYNYIFSSISTGFARFDIGNMNLIFCNLRFAEIYGYEDVDSCIDNYRLEERTFNKERITRFFKKLKANGFIQEYETTMSKANGEEVNLVLSARYVEEEDFMDVVLLDVSLCRKHKFVDLNYEFMYKSLFDSMPVAALMLGEDYEILDLNGEFESFLGYLNSDLLSKNFSCLFEKEGDFENLKFLISQNTRVRGFETNLMTNEKRVVQVLISLDKFELGENVFVRVLIENLTEKKMIEKKLLDSYKHLAVVNRQISILLELNSQVGREKSRGVLNFILESAIALSDALSVSFYRVSDNSFMHLMSYARNQSDLITIDTFDFGDLTTFDDVLSSGKRAQCIFDHLTDIEKMRISKGDSLKDFLILPVKNFVDVEGVFVMFFEDIHSLNTQELAFYEAFVLQASLVLKNTEII